MEIVNLLYEFEDAVVLKVTLDELGYPMIRVTEMLDTAYMVYLPDEDVDAFEDALKQPPLKTSIMGTYHMDGTQYIWTEPGTIQRNHSINKYKNMLKDIVEYDEDGNETGTRPPTEEEALNTPVNRYYGTPPRNLSEPAPSQ